MNSDTRIDAYKELLRTSKAVWKYFESGELCRSTAGDHELNWAIKQIPVVRALAEWDEAIKKATGGDA